MPRGVRLKRQTKRLWRLRGPVGLGVNKPCYALNYGYSGTRACVRVERTFVLPHSKRPSVIHMLGICLRDGVLGGERKIYVAFFHFRSQNTRQTRRFSFLHFLHLSSSFCIFELSQFIELLDLQRETRRRLLLDWP